jgi:hypothetical protein
MAEEGIGAAEIEHELRILSHDGLPKVLLAGAAMPPEL